MIGAFIVNWLGDFVDKFEHFLKTGLCVTNQSFCFTEATVVTLPSKSYCQKSILAKYFISIPLENVRKPLTYCRFQRYRNGTFG